jgi:hypothetical protein
MHTTARGVRRFGELWPSMYVTVAPAKREKRANRAARHRLNPGCRTVAANQKARAAAVDRPLASAGGR